MQNTKAVPRIFVCQFLEESNSFNPLLAEFESFLSRGIFKGDALVNSDGKCGDTVSGILDRICEGGYEAVGGLRMSSGSAGPLNDETIVKYFRENNLKELKAAGRLDGVVVSMHGATVSDKSEDVCGDVLEEIRKTVGEEIPIGVSFDLHANVTDKICKNADFVCGYQTYPHIDHYNVGYRAADLVIRSIEGKTAKLAKASVPMMAPAHAYTTTDGALSRLMKQGFDMVESGEIIDFSIFQVQPWLDVRDISSAVVVVAKDNQTAKSAAQKLATGEFKLREELLGEKLFSIEEVVGFANTNKDNQPIVLVNSADSSNAGANGDSAAVLECILPYCETLSAATMVTDANAVEKAFELGVGATGDFTVGGGIAAELSKPVEVKNATVKGLYDGKFTLFGPAEKGKERDLGKTAILQVGKIMIHLSSRSQNAGDLNFYRSFGIEPTKCRLVEVKACTSFKAGYLPITSKIYNTMAPGAACPVLTNLPYKRLPKPFYPFDEISDTDITAAKCFR